MEVLNTRHEIVFGDSYEILRGLPDSAFQLMVTSPPYWNVRDYSADGQIGHGQSLEDYLQSLASVWKEVARTLLPDGKMAVNIGNVYYTIPGESRRTTANLVHAVWKQISEIRDLRFMGTIYWQKTTSRKGSVLFGSYPYPTNFMISSAVESIHIFRKLGKRKPDPDMKRMSRVTLHEFREFRDAIWHVNGIEDRHAAAFPYELPKRLIRMFSFVGDHVLDPFAGSGTTAMAARDLGRNSFNIDINEDFLDIMMEKINFESRKNLTLADGRKIATRGDFYVKRLQDTAGQPLKYA